MSVTRFVQPWVVVGLGAALATASCAGRGTAKQRAKWHGQASAVWSQIPREGPFSPRSMMADINWLCARERMGRGSFQPGGMATAEYVAAQFRELGLEVRRQQIPRGGENVVGILRAGPTAVIVSAHYDHLGVDGDGVIFPGADDNASGVAVMLAIARDAVRTKHRNTIMFIAFGAEDLGHVGSAEYMVNPIWPLEKTAAIVNFDMVGRNFFEAGANQPDTVAVIGLESKPGAPPLLHRAAAEFGLKLIETPARLLEVFGYDNRTDEWWFRRRGHVAIHFSTGFHDDYHRPSDTADKLRPTQMVRIARTAAALVAYLAADESR